MAMATNGTLIKKNKIKNMLEAFTWMRFNISAANRETYSTIHKKDLFDTVVENIRACVETKKKYKLKTTIGTQIIVMHENVDEIIPLAKLGKELGIDYLVIKPCSNTQDKRIKALSKEYLEMNNIYREAEKYSDAKYNVLIKWSKFKNVGLCDFSRCRGTQFIIAISGRGDVAPCGHLLGYRKDEFKMGNIIEQPLKNIIAEERYWNVQNRVQEIDVNTECESNCLHYYMNSFLERLNNPPDHINFI